MKQESGTAFNADLQEGEKAKQARRVRIGLPRGGHQQGFHFRVQISSNFQRGKIIIRREITRHQIVRKMIAVITFVNEDVDRGVRCRACRERARSGAPVRSKMS